MQTSLSIPLQVYSSPFHVSPPHSSPPPNYFTLYNTHHDHCYYPSFSPKLKTKFTHFSFQFPISFPDMAEPQHYQQNDPSRKYTPSSHVLVLATLVPLGASLLLVAGLTLAATVIGIAVAAPLFVIFSPVLIPATIVIGLAVAGFLTSGAFGVTSLSSFAWIASFLRRSRLQEQLQHAKNRAQEIMGNVAHRAKEAGQSVINEAQNLTQTEAQSEAQIDAQSDSQSEAPSVVQSDTQSEAHEAGKAQGDNKTSS